jgi:ABC-type multidrug transport system ATPase subunit
MVIYVQNLSKRYGYHWIIKDLNYTFDQSVIYGISGRNGSGKSTLIKLISGYLSPSEGKIIYELNGAIISVSQVYKHLSWVAPYTDVIQEFTLEEIYHFHKKFKKLRNDLSFQEFLNMLEWKNTNEKEIKFFSSGMNQKLQLALAVLSDTDLLILDEPTSFLDQNAKIWFKNFLMNFCDNRIVIISSNDPFDLSLCGNVLSLNIDNF